MADDPSATPVEIVRASTLLGVDAHLLPTDTRRTAVVRARHVAAWILVRRLGWTYAQAGRRLRRSHATISHSVAVVDADAELLSVAGRATKV